MVACAAALSGCSAQAIGQDAADAAARFLSATETGDLAAACALLTPRTRDEFAVSDGPCEESLPADQLGGTITGTDAWSDWAKVSTGQDAMFLTEFESGWRVAAAGCRPNGDAPYRCLVGG